VTATDDLPVLEFADPAALEAWLEAEHQRAPGAYLRIAKKGTTPTTVTQAQAIESLLCFGWIDGQIRPLDERHYLVRVTPRRARSVWSKRNVETVERLTAEGRMRPAGLAAVEAAQSDGRWEQAYAGSATMTVPDDLAAALTAVPKAQRTFDGLNATNRYAVLWRVHTARTPQTRARRIAQLVQMLAEGKTFH
jgi:uncharacterized protein YdeI (YjbR/CyaY-like superfamily)